MRYLYPNKLYITHRRMVTHIQCSQKCGQICHTVGQKEVANGFKVGLSSKYSRWVSLDFTAFGHFKR